LEANKTHVVTTTDRPIYASLLDTNHGLLTPTKYSEELMYMHTNIQNFLLLQLNTCLARKGMLKDGEGRCYHMASFYGRRTDDCRTKIPTLLPSGRYV
jgi:hypothetical protein